MKVLLHRASLHLALAAALSISALTLEVPAARADGSLVNSVVSGVISGVISGAVQRGNSSTNASASAATDPALAAYGLVKTDCGPSTVHIAFRGGQQLCAIATPNYPPGTYKEMDGGELQPYGLSARNGGSFSVPTGAPQPGYPNPVYAAYPSPYPPSAAGGSPYWTPGSQYSPPATPTAAPPAGAWPSPPAPGAYPPAPPPAYGYSLPATNFPPILFTNNPAQAVNPADAARIQASLAVQGLSPAPCNAAPGALVVVSVGPYTACAYPAANFQAGHYRMPAPTGLAYTGF